MAFGVWWLFFCMFSSLPLAWQGHFTLKVRLWRFPFQLPWFFPVTILLPGLHLRPVITSYNKRTHKANSGFDVLFAFYRRSKATTSKRNTCDNRQQPVADGARSYIKCISAGVRVFLQNSSAPGITPKMKSQSLANSQKKQLTLIFRRRIARILPKVGDNSIKGVKRTSPFPNQFS